MRLPIGVVPICLLYADADIDLCRIFADKGVKVYSGACFSGLGKNSIRLNLPNEEKMANLIDIVKNIVI